jgi:hypothetical protein
VLVSPYQVPLCKSAKETLEEITRGDNNRDVLYYWSPMVSMRKVVPTLTSNERWDQPLDSSVLATKDTEFILVPAGAVCPAVVCSRHCIALHRGARRGGLQAWRRGGLASKSQRY